MIFQKLKGAVLPTWRSQMDEGWEAVIGLGEWEASGWGGRTQIQWTASVDREEVEEASIDREFEEFGSKGKI